MGETLDYVKMFARFPLAVRRFSRRSLTLERAQRGVLQRMQQREQNLIRLLDESIYRFPRSPYLPLLRMAGCELGDLEAMVKSVGLEETLRELRRQGVYVTFEEFKGRKPIVRNGVTIEVKPSDFDNPSARRDWMVTTGGSTGLAVAVGQDLDYIADRAPHEVITLSTYGLLGAPTALWSYILPASTFRRVFQLALFGQLPQRWFSPIGWRDSKYWFKYDLATLYMVACARLAGMKIPFPRVVKIEKPFRVVQWIREMLDSHPACLLYAGVSRTLRLCRAAQEAGLDLTGATVRGGGEPVTAAKVRALQRAGVRYIPNYALSEAGYLAAGCAKPDQVSDMHLLKDAFALFTFDYPVEAFATTVPAFNLTNLLPKAPKIMLNLQMDDYGIIEERACGCELESYGYTTHLRQVFSYSKIVGEGVTLIGSEMLRILEEVLPGRFGGTPLDYQLMEQEQEDGLTRLYLIISPRVEIRDEGEVVQVMLNAMRASSPMADVARTIWQQTHTIQVKRQEPVFSPFGKLLPLRIRSENRSSPPR